MMKLSKRACVFKVLVLVLFCSGCGPQAHHNHPHAGAAESGHQKPGADIQLITPQIAIREVGYSLRFNLGLRVGHTEGFLSVRLGSSDGVDVLGDKEFQVVLGESAVVSLPVDLYTLSKGRHYLPINAIVELPGGQRLHRAFSVVVQVGRPKHLGKKSDKAEPIQDSNGRPIKVLPATEEIR